jgi:hypothetical protein
VPPNPLVLSWCGREPGAECVARPWSLCRLLSVGSCRWLSPLLPGASPHSPVLFTVAVAPLDVPLTMVAIALPGPALLLGRSAPLSESCVGQPRLRLVTAVPGHGRLSHRSLSVGPLIQPAAFLVVVRSGTLLVIVRSTLGNWLFESLMASAALPGHRSVSLPHLRSMPTCPLWRQPPPPPPGTLSFAGMTVDP